jgi:membrane-associated phospholipid phosphatase
MAMRTVIVPQSFIPPKNCRPESMIPSDPAAPNNEYSVPLLDRLATRWRTKMVLNVFGILAFFGVYFWVLGHPFFEPFEMPLTALDAWIDFRPAAIVLYGSLWFYVSIPLALLIRKHEIVSYGVAAFALSAAGMAIFIVWPTTIPVFQIDWSQHPTSAFLKNLDATGNACPSLHVAFAIFSAVWLQRLLREMGTGLPIRTANWVWCAAILYSTIATRQHVVLDVVAGAVLGIFVVTANLLWLHRIESRHASS